MRAVIWTAYGPPEVLQMREVEKPVPGDDEILVRIHATTVTAGDCETRRLDMPVFLGLPMRIYVGFWRPKRITVLGQEYAGEIEAIGQDVTRFAVGDEVFGQTDFSMGAYAEYKVLSEAADGVVAIKPANMTYEEAAAVPLGGIEALHFLTRGDVNSGEHVLINGAGGSIGTVGVQLAKHFGAEVTAVDSAEKLDMLRSIGADHVIDYAQQDFTGCCETYDVIFDVIGKAPYARSVESLKPGGRLLLANPRLSLLVRSWWTSVTSDKRVVMGSSSQDAEPLLFLKQLIEAGKLKSVIDRRYPLDQIVDAHRYVEAGHKKGNVVITVAAGLEAEE